MVQIRDILVGGLLLFLGSALWSCGEETPFDDRTGNPLQLTGEKNPHASVSAAPDTYVSITGLDYSFSTGDEIGVFVSKVSDGSIVAGNLKWKYDGTTFLPEAGQEFTYAGDAVSIRAYYPYNAAQATYPDPKNITVGSPQTAATFTSELLISTTHLWGGEPKVFALRFLHTLALIEVVPPTYGGETATKITSFNVLTQIATPTIGDIEHTTEDIIGAGKFLLLLPLQDYSTLKVNGSYIKIEYPPNYIIYSYTSLLSMESPNFVFQAGFYYKYNITTLAP